MNVKNMKGLEDKEDQIKQNFYKNIKHIYKALISSTYFPCCLSTSIGRRDRVK